MNDVNIRLAVADDAEKMLAIYTPYVENTGVSFEDHPPEARSFRGRIEQTMEKLPWLVAEINGMVGGYAYAVPHRIRAAYAWSAEVSVYIAPHFRRMGLAELLYRHLLALLRKQGYRNLYALITLPNPESTALHAKLGFRETGLHRHAGYKLGRWHDVLWMELDLFDGREPEEHLAHPRPLPKLIASGEIQETVYESGVAAAV